MDSIDKVQDYLNNLNLNENENNTEVITKNNDTNDNTDSDDDTEDKPYFTISQVKTKKNSRKYKIYQLTTTFPYKILDEFEGPLHASRKLEISKAGVKRVLKTSTHSFTKEDEYSKTFWVRINNGDSIPFENASEEEKNLYNNSIIFPKSAVAEIKHDNSCILNIYSTQKDAISAIGLKETSKGGKNELNGVQIKEVM